MNFMNFMNFITLLTLFAERVQTKDPAADAVGSCFCSLSRNDLFCDFSLHRDD